MITLLSAPLTAGLTGSKPGLPAVDMAMNLTGIAPGSVVTTAALKARMLGGSSWSISLQFGSSHPGGSLQRTKVVSDSAVSHPDLFSVAGQQYSGAEGLAIEVDMSSRTGNDQKFEGWKLVAPGDITATDITVSGLIRFSAVGDPAHLQDTRIDHVMINATGNYSVMQQYVAWNGSGAGVIHTHADGNSMGLGIYGPSGSVSAGVWYRYDLRKKGNNAEVLLRRADTGEPVHASLHYTAGNRVSEITFWDYLVSYGGTTRYKGIILGLGANARMPLGKMTFAMTPPTFTDVTQTATNTVQVAWSSIAHDHTLERRVNGGTWETISGAYRGTSYVDTALSDGQSVEYRVARRIGDHWSAPAASELLVINNNPTYPLTDDFNTDGISLTERPGWTVTTGGYLFIDSRLRATSSSLSMAYRRVDVAASQRVEVTLGGTDFFTYTGAAVRVQDDPAGSGYVCYTHGGTMYLFRVIAGTDTELASGSRSLGAGHRIALEVTGTGAATRINVQVDTGSGWTNVWMDINPGAPYYDTGKPGIASFRGGGGTTLTKWVASSLT